MNKFFAFVWVVLTLTSCLDEHPKNLLTEDEAYSSARNLYVNAVATLYNHIGGKADSQSLQGTYRGVYDYNTFCTDEAMIPIEAAIGTTEASGRIFTNINGHLEMCLFTRRGCIFTRSLCSATSLCNSWISTPICLLTRSTRLIGPR